jgi:hypothetical protein
MNGMWHAEISGDIWLEAGALQLYMTRSRYLPYRVEGEQSDGNRWVG